MKKIKKLEELLAHDWETVVNQMDFSLIFDIIQEHQDKINEIIEELNTRKEDSK